MTHTRYAFVKTIWRAGTFDESRDSRVHKPPLDALLSDDTRVALAT